MRKLLLTWLMLVVLLMVEIAASWIPMNPACRPLILLAAAAMCAIVVARFMQVGRGPTVVRLFAAAGLVWLIILLALGAMDPLTRVVYPVR